MLIKKFDGGLYARFLKDEKVMEGLSSLMLQEQIASGSITGLGAVKNTRLGYYNLEKKEYIEKLFEDEMELAGLVGNLSYFEKKPIVHAHATLSDTQQRAFAGHLFETTTAVTVEICVRITTVELQRKLDPEIGLNLLDLQ